VVKKRLKSVGVWTARVVAALVIIVALLVGFGTPASDAEKMRKFAQAVDQWQTNPDFRKVQVEYAEMGSDAMRSKVAFFPSKKMVMWLRSLPGLPPHLKVNDTSFVHYENFTRGPLSAYMHLTTEQGLTDTLNMLMYLGAKPDLNDDDIRNFLKSYKLHNPVVSDAGAVMSVRSLINDVNAGTKFPVSGNVADKLKAHIATIAGQMNYPTDIREMTPEQQNKVWAALDGEVKETDYELWRTKQVNDWLNGVWAQVYGTMYSGAIYPLLKIRAASQVAGPVMLAGWIGIGLWRRRREAGSSVEGVHVAEPRLALEGGDDGSAI
jgi:hypothetical protein